MLNYVKIKGFWGRQMRGGGSEATEGAVAGRGAGSQYALIA
jgi:hypothetical protein